jgi:hypothetical protein
MKYDPHHEAKACTNELYYRNGHIPEDIRRDDVSYVVKTIERYLTEAYNQSAKSSF